MFLSYVFVYYGCLRQFLRGERKQAMMLFVAVTIFALTAFVDLFVHVGLIEFIYIGEYGFLLLVVIMSWTLIAERRHLDKTGQAAQKTSCL